LNLKLITPTNAKPFEFNNLDNDPLMTSLSPLASGSVGDRMRFDDPLDNMMSDTEISDRRPLPYARNDSTSSPYPD